MRRLVVERPPSLAALWSRRLGLFALAVMAIAVALSWLGRIDPAAALAVLGLGLLLAAMARCCRSLRSSPSGTRGGRVFREGRRGPDAGGNVGRVSVVSRRSGAAVAAPERYQHRHRRPAVVLAVAPGARSTRRARAARGTAAGPRRGRRRPIRRYSRWCWTSRQGELRPRAEGGQPARLAGDRDRHARRARRDGRLEAIDHSLAMRFPRDVTVRLRPTAAGTRIESGLPPRFPIHDFGANARRIAAFAEAVQWPTT